LKGTERDRISQEASNCQPLVRIELEEVPFGNRSFLLVKVPRSNVVHNDLQRKFPVRVGNITGYLDAYGLISLLQERGLTRPESIQQLSPQVEQKRTPLPADEMALLSRGLESNDPAIRLEAIRDLTSTPFKYVVLENKSVSKLIGNLLESGSLEEKGLALDLVHYVSNWGTPKEKEIVSSWTAALVNIGKTSSTDIARKAFDALLSARRQETIDVLLQWIKERTDEEYAVLQPGSILTNLSYYGLRTHVREALYSLLQQSPEQRTRKRTLDILKVIRTGY